MQLICWSITGTKACRPQNVWCIQYPKLLSTKKNTKYEKMKIYKRIMGVWSALATDAIVLKRQASSIHSAKYLSYRTSFIKMLHQQWTQSKTEITFFAKITQFFNGKEKHFSSYVKRNDTLNIVPIIGTLFQQISDSRR